MGKKKRKKSLGGGFASMGRVFSESMSLFVKSIPMLLVIFAAGAMFMGIRSALYADYNLSVQKVTVEPAQALSQTQRERLDSQILGKNILNTDLAAIAQSLEKDAAILNVKATRRLPSEIFIEVQKRKPFAFIRFASGPQNFGVISEDGMILETADAKAATGLIVEVQGNGIQRPNIGQHFKNRGFQEAVQFFMVYQNTLLSAQEPVTKISIDALGNVNVVLREGPEVRLGRRPSQRVDAFKKITPLLEGEMRGKIAYIDLQYDDIVVKQKGAK